MSWTRTGLMVKQWLGFCIRHTIGRNQTFFWIQTIDKIILDINKKEEIKDLSQNQQNSKFT